MAKKIRDKAVSGVKWTTIEKISTQILRFVIGIIVARLVTPADYGLIAMLAIFTSIGDVFINSGFNTALICNKENTQADYSTAFFFNVGVGMAVYLILFLCAPLIASFYDIPELLDVTRLYTLTLLIGSLSVVQIAKLTHEFRFKLQFFVNLISLIASGAAGILMAVKGYGVWALVWQGLTYTVLRTVLFWLCSGWHPILVFSRKSFNYLFSFGSKLLIVNIVDIIYENVYTLVVGKYYSASSAGFYNRSLQIAQLPKSVITEIVNKVMLPLLAPYQDDKEVLIAVYNRIIRLVVFVTYPLLVLLVVLAKPIIFIMLGEPWLPAAPYLQILSLSVIFSMLSNININLLYVKGRSDIILKIDIQKKLLGFLIVIIMVPLGLYWICFGTILYAIFAFIINCHQTKKILDFGFLSQVKSIIPALTYSAIIGGVVYFVSMFFSSSFLQIIIGGVLGMALYILLTSIVKDPSFNELLNIVKKQYGK